MTTFIEIVLFLIFFLISSIHFFWAFGGTWGVDAVLPTKDDNNTKVLNPALLPTLIVALVFLCFGFFILIISGILSFTLPQLLSKYGLWFIASIFVLRAIGDFKYLVFFIKNGSVLVGKVQYKFAVIL